MPVWGRVGVMLVSQTGVDGEFCRGVMPQQNRSAADAGSRKCKVETMCHDDGQHVGLGWEAAE
eukprot:3705832-Rhodomonas_salina.5